MKIKTNTDTEVYLWDLLAWEDRNRNSIKNWITPEVYISILFNKAYKTIKLFSKGALVAQIYTDNNLTILETAVIIQDIIKMLVDKT